MSASIWLAIPSKRPPEEAEPVLKAWRERGYRIALWRDDDEYKPFMDGTSADLCIGSEQDYPGYAQAVNQLLKVVRLYSEGAGDPAEWFVCAGDDTLPDPNHTAEEIAQECVEHFDLVGLAHLPDKTMHPNWRYGPTFGVMQPTGDRWGEGQGGFATAPIDRVAGSPWIGREFARRMYGGTGPYWHEYRHMFVDEELQRVAQNLGVFWQRPDLIQFHNHWGRPRPGEVMAPVERMPAFLAEANSPENWRKSKALFEARLMAGFPGHEPIA